MSLGLSALNSISLDESTSSSDAADILIRSTKVGFQQNRQKVQCEGIESALSSHSKVNIYVRRLSDSVNGSGLAKTSEHGFPEQQLPPVLHVNMPSASSTGSEEHRHMASDQACGVGRSNVTRAGEDTKKTPTAQTRNSKQEGQDVLISRYSNHGRGAIVAALNQRSYSAPVRRKVKVQFLDKGSPQSIGLQAPEVQPNHALASGDPGAATTVAAITAAAIAATAPLIKAQSDMEARMAQVTSELRRLQDADGQANRASESRSGSAADRVAQLEEQLTLLTQQRFQHLERIQSQQLELQNRILDSALNVGTSTNLLSQSASHAGVGMRVPASVQMPGINRLPVVEEWSSGDPGCTDVQDQGRDSSRGGTGSLLEVPAPRKVIPKPTHWNRAANSIQHSSVTTQKSAQKKRGNGRLQEQLSNNQRSTRHAAQSDRVKGVAIATVNDSQPEHSRENRQERSGCPNGRGEPAGVFTSFHNKNESQGSLKDGTTAVNRSPDSSNSAMQQASAMLQDLSRLKDEMKVLIQTADAFPVRRNEPSHIHNTPSNLPSPPPPPPLPPPVSMPSELGDEIAPKATPLSRLSTLQNSHPPASMFEDAESVLRQVRQSRKVLEENLQAVLRAKDGEVLHKQLEALANNRNASEELRIRKTVDAWINTLNKEIQDELSQQESAVQMSTVERDSRAASSSAQRDLSSRNRSTAGKETGRVGRGQKGASAAVERKPINSDSIRPQALSKEASSQKLASSLRSNIEKHPQAVLMPKSKNDEAYLKKVYGKAIYEGHRHTLKKGPYLRFSSPTPKSKVQRPKVIERVKGVKMKSCKTQTSVPGPRAASRLLQPAVTEPQYLFSPSGLVQQQQHEAGSLLEGYLIPMAIPLGKPRVDSQPPLPSRLIISDKPAIVTTSLLPGPCSAPTVAPVIRKPNTVLLEVHSEPRRPIPHLQIQVQPSVNIENVTDSEPSPPVLPHLAFQAGEDAQPFAAEDEESDSIPGSSLLADADISQEPEVEVEFFEAPIELNGLPSPPAALYHGPAFPAQRSQPASLTNPVLATIQQRETLENRLVDWVEQQLMARVINDMINLPTQTDLVSQSEPEDSVTSDIVETAGGRGLQLFVDAGVPVDSELIRQCVNEVLADIISRMLGQEEGPTEGAAPVPTKEMHTQQESTLPTPLATPEPSVSPPAPRGSPSPIRTPDLSDHPSPTQSPRDMQPVQPQQPVLPEKDPVETPVSTPVSSPLRIATPEPAILHNHPWEDAELPLREERPHNEEEEQQQLPVVLSVAYEEEEEEVAAVPPSSQVLSKPQNPTTAVEEYTEAVPPESPSVKESSSQSSSSITETETAARHISEGELLLSCGQMAAVRALDQESIILPNMMTSFNSSLHGVQDMDYDPPSEGEVIRRLHTQVQHDPILSLLARMEQGSAVRSHQREKWWDGESSGELSEGQQPVLTGAQEKVVTAHSVISQHPSIESNEEQSPHATLSSPGQLPTQQTGGRGADMCGGLLIDFQQVGKHTETPHVLQSCTTAPPEHVDSSPQQDTETHQLVQRPAPIMVTQCHNEEETEFLHQRRSSNDMDSFFEDTNKGVEVPLRTAGGGGGGGLGQMSVQLQSVQNDDQSPTISAIEGDSDSISDVF